MIRKISLALIITCTTIILLTTSTTGLKVALSLYNHSSKNKISYSKLKGSLLTGFSSSKLNITSPDFTASIDGLVINWNLTTPSLTNVEFDSIRAKNIKIKLTKPKRKGSIGTHFPHINKLLIKSIEIARINIQDHQKQEIEIRNITGNVELTNKSLNANIKTHLLSPLESDISFLARGQPENLNLNLTVNQDKQEWSLKGKLKHNAFKFHTENNKLFSGSLETKGSVSFFPIKWNIEMLGTNIKLSPITPTIQSPISLRGKSSGEISKSNKIISNSAVTISTKLNKLTTSITTGSETHLTWGAKLNNLNDLYSRITGDLFSTGTITLSDNKPTSAKILARSKEIKFNKTKISKLSINSNITSKSAKNKIKIDKAQYNKLRIRKLIIHSSGALSSQNLSINGIVNTININTNILLKKHTNTWKILVKKLKSRLHHFTLQLTKPVSAEASIDHFKVNNLCLSSNATSLCGNLALSHDGWHASLSTKRVPYLLLKPFVKLNLIKNATLNSNIAINSKNNKISNAKFKFEVKNLALQTSYSSKMNTIGFLSASAKYSNSQWLGSAQLNDKMAGNAHLTIHYNTSNSAISGNFNSHIDNMTPLNNVFDVVNLQSGSVISQLQFFGSIKKPIITGNVKAQNLSLQIPSVGLTVSHASCDIKASQHQLQTQAKVSINKKSLYILGTTDLTKPSFPSLLTITGKNFPFFDSPFFKASGSPQLKMKLSLKKLELWGKLKITRARLYRYSTNKIVTLPENDIVYSDIKKNRIFPTSLSVDISLGPDVIMSTPTIQALLYGNLYLRKNANNPVYANGSISIAKGQYHTLGHTLSIAKHSSLIFSNSLLNNPSLSITATKKIENTSSNLASEIVAGVKVTGNINSPQISLFSIPNTLSQNQILSLLIFGYTYDMDNIADSQNILNALSALQLAQTGISNKPNSNPFESLKRKLGISNFSIENQSSSDALGNKISSNQQTSLVLTKPLSKNIYLRYIRDLSSVTPYNVVQAIFHISKKWTIRASANLSDSQNSISTPFNAENYYNGIDLVYSYYKN